MLRRPGLLALLAAVLSADAALRLAAGQGALFEAIPQAVDEKGLREYTVRAFYPLLRFWKLTDSWQCSGQQAQERTGACGGICHAC